MNAPLPAPPFAVPHELLDSVVARYAEPHRAYHDVAHLREVFEQYAFVEHATGWSHPREVWLALLFHDAIYEPGRTDNEERSAALATSELARRMPDARLDLARIERLILLTARHGGVDAAELDEEAALFLDCDMAILGAEPERFDAYDRGIAREYATVPPELFAAGRRRFLEGLLGPKPIFLSPLFRDRFEQRARDNLARALG